MKILIKLRFFLSIEYWKQHYKEVLEYIFAILGGLWLISELVNYFIKDDLVPKNYGVFCAFIVTSFILALFSNMQKLTYIYTIKDKDIRIKLVIGNILNQKGDIVIATNTTFDTTFENDFISSKSLQGQFELKYYKNKLEQLDIQMESALHNIEKQEVLHRAHSKNNKYKIGTVIKLTHNKFKSYWITLADVNENGKPQSNFENLQLCLDSLWNYVLTNGHMDKLVIPIIGSGRTGINENRTKILKEIIHSFITFSSQRKITEELVICIWPNDFLKHKINLTDIVRYLDYYCEFGHHNL